MSFILDDGSDGAADTGSIFDLLLAPLKDERIEQLPSLYTDACATKHHSDGIRMKVYYCHTCVVVGDRYLCSFCAMCCHQGHAVREASIVDAAVCACSTACLPCKSPATSSEHRTIASIATSVKLAELATPPCGARAPGLLAHLPLSFTSDVVVPDDHEQRTDKFGDSLADLLRALRSLDEVPVAQTTGPEAVDQGKARFLSTLNPAVGADIAHDTSSVDSVVTLNIDDGPVLKAGEATVQAAPRGPAVLCHNTSSAGTSALTCVVCMDAPTNAVMVPCGHVCACYSCALCIHKGDARGAAHQVPRCPMCMTPAQAVVRLFFTR